MCDRRHSNKEDSNHIIRNRSLLIVHGTYNNLLDYLSNIISGWNISTHNPYYVHFKDILYAIQPTFSLHIKTLRDILISCADVHNNNSAFRYILQSLKWIMPDNPQKNKNDKYKYLDMFYEGSYKCINRVRFGEYKSIPIIDIISYVLLVRLSTIKDYFDLHKYPNKLNKFDNYVIEQINIIIPYLESLLLDFREYHDKNRKNICRYIDYCVYETLKKKSVDHRKDSQIDPTEKFVLDLNKTYNHEERQNVNEHNSKVSFIYKMEIKNNVRVLSKLLMNDTLINTVKKNVNGNLNIYFMNILVFIDNKLTIIESLFDGLDYGLSLINAINFSDKNPKINKLLMCNNDIAEMKKKTSSDNAYFTKMLNEENGKMSFVEVLVYENKVF
jgi:hypothetical protein